MRRIVIFMLLVIAVNAKAQQIACTVVDSAAGTPLGYASVNISHQKKMLYTDSTGRFLVNRDTVDGRDTVYIQYVGYKQLAVPIAGLGPLNTLRMAPEPGMLKPVEVTNCRKVREYMINRRVGKIKEYIGPGPETKFIIIGRYLYPKEAEGYIKQLEIFSGNFNENIHVPVRLHWYAWDSSSNLPGRELTSQNILFYLGRQGWNNFTLPENAVYFSGGGIVLGLEFIYPVEYMRRYNLLQTVDEKVTWLMNMQNRWSLGIQTTKDAAQTGFYQVNNLPVMRYSSRGRNLFIKPAIRFTLTKCLE